MKAEETGMPTSVLEALQVLNADLRALELANEESGDPQSSIKRIGRDLIQHTIGFTQECHKFGIDPKVTYDRVLGAPKGKLDSSSKVQALPADTFDTLTP